MRHLLLAPFMTWAGRLKYPTLFKLVAGLFVFTLLVPDGLPFVDEILLGLATLLLAKWKNRNQQPASAAGMPGKRAPIEGHASRR
ncbi:hypothetical protein CO615_00440 [Lysobacteraceae bacterium NML75-0749]|nr:hypothetical protein CO609_09840 [Xanthomonadaceae bacterium NML91-0268]PJK03546.1 hypothetical protein CO615_00440 [Xanthomonadaceae bacterium NML75-0749]